MLWNCYKMGTQFVWEASLKTQDMKMQKLQQEKIKLGFGNITLTYHQ